MGIESKFEGGLRVTDAKTVEIVEMVLAGSINKEIVALINQTGEWAIGLCGKDGNMVFAEKAKKTVIDPDSNIERVLDLGFVGEVVEVDRTLLDLLAKSEMIPVIAPVAPGRDGATYNINADTFAGAHRFAGTRPHQGRHDFRRHDPEGRDLHRRHQGWCSGCGDPQRQDAALRPSGNLHRRRRHAHRALMCFGVADGKPVRHIRH